MSTDPRPDAPRFFLDRSIGKNELAGRIRAAGYQVELHDDHLGSTARDEEWLALCGREQWIALTVDRLRERPNERSAVRDHRARVVIVRAGRRSGSQIADLVVRKLRVIESFAARTPAPFLATLTAHAIRPVRLPRED